LHLLVVTWQFGPIYRGHGPHAELKYGIDTCIALVPIMLDPGMAIGPRHERIVDAIPSESRANVGYIRETILRSNMLDQSGQPYVGRSVFERH
jgi:hypothetical protein